MVAGQTLAIDGKDVRCPSAPLFLLKANGVTVDIDTHHFSIDALFNTCVSTDRELWKLDTKGAWHLIRRMSSGRERGNE